MRAWIAFAALFACIAAANAEAPTIEFDGSTFQLAYEDQATQENGDPGNGLAEFTLPDENVDNWSKLFAFHSFPTMGDDPLAAVQTVGKVVKETNPAANFAIIENKEKGEAIIDFLTWAPDSDVMEFNVFKYAPAADGQGLVAMQFAQHIKLGDISVEEMRALRTRAVEEMADTDIEAAQNYFESVGEKSGDSAAADSGSSTVARAGRKD
jgi:hypothetical protein